MATYYHGTNDTLCPGDEMWENACITDSYNAAAQYGATVYEVRIEGELRWADEEELIAAADAVGFQHEGRWAFEVADEDEVREELARRGFHGVQHADSTYDNKSYMTCFRSLVDGVFVVVGACE